MPNKKKKKKHTRIVGGMVDFLSLCSKGANRIETVYKSDDGEEGDICISTWTSKMSEQGEITAIVYAPEFRDSQGDIASANAIKSMQREFSRKGGNIDINHDETPLSKDDIYIAENFIVDKGDSRFSDMRDYDGNSIENIDGAWAVVLKVASEDLRQKYRDGEWKGISLGGMVSKIEEKSADSKVGEFVAKMLKYINKNQEISQEEQDMDKSQVESMIETAMKKSMPDMLKKALESVEKKTKKSDEIENRLTDGEQKPTMAKVRDILEKSAAKDWEAENKEGKAVEVSEVEVSKAYTKAMNMYKMAYEVDADNPDAVNAFLAKKALIEAEDEEDRSPLWASCMKTSQSVKKEDTAKKAGNTSEKADDAIISHIEKKYSDKK